MNSVQKGPMPFVERWEASMFDEDFKYFRPIFSSLLKMNILEPWVMLQFNEK
jgi:hypothetical protein